MCLAGDNFLPLGIEKITKRLSATTSLKTHTVFLFVTKFVTKYEGENESDQFIKYATTLWAASTLLYPKQQCLINKAN